MPPAGFEPTVSAGERPQTYALDRAATGTDILTGWYLKIKEYTADQNSYSHLIHHILHFYVFYGDHV